MTSQIDGHFLQVPGPTNVPDEVLRAISAATIDHRGPQFSDLTLAGTLAGVQMGLTLAGVPVDPRGMEAALDRLSSP